MDGIIPILFAIIALVSSLVNLVKKMKSPQATAKKKDAETEFAPVSAPPPLEKPKPSPASVHTPPAAPAFVPAQMGLEGEDACHEYMLPDQEPLVAKASPLEEDEEASLAQDLVRGVVFSEILHRPQPRAYGRRRA